MGRLVFVVRGQAPLDGVGPRHNYGAKVARSTHRGARAELVARYPAIAALDTAEQPNVGFAEHQNIAKGHHNATGGSAQARPSVSAAQCGITSVPMSPIFRTVPPSSIWLG